MNENEAKKDSSTRTRKAIVTLLKQHGAMDAAALSVKLSLTGMAIRQHLYILQNERVVEYEEEARPMGRPAKLWRLTPEANRWFPNGYSELSVSLIDSMREAFGEVGLDQLLAVRNKTQQEQYLGQMSDASGIREKLEKLRSIRMNEGYFAEIQDQADGSYLFVQNHCPISKAAAACTGLCQSELCLFRTVLGNNVDIERVEYLLSGGRRCVYKVMDEQK
jgi:predicted ArsR family transcriptional regulator